MVPSTNGTAAALRPSRARIQSPKGLSASVDASVAHHRNTTGSRPRLASAFQPACRPAAQNTSTREKRVTRQAAREPTRSRSAAQLLQALREGVDHSGHVLGRERPHVRYAEGVGPDLPLARVDDVVASL